MKSTINIVLGDITNFNPDVEPSAIVNAANVRLLGGSGVDGAIHRAAGSQLRQACQQLPEIMPGVRCMTGCAKLTPAGNLSVDYVIHAVGPIWPSPNARDPAFTGEQPCKTDQEARSLLQCCINTCFTFALAKGVKALAFPAISCGVFGGKIEVFAEVLHETMAAIEADGHTLPEVTVFLFHDLELAVFSSSWETLTE